MSPTDPTLWELVANVTDSLEERAELHIELAKAQLAQAAKDIGRGVVPLALGAMLLGLGYIFLCVAAGLAIAALVAPPVAVGVVAVFNLLIGAGAVGFGLSVWNARTALAAGPQERHAGGSVLDVG